MLVIICFSGGPYFIQQAAIRHYCVNYLVFFASLEGSRLIDYLKYDVHVEPRDSLLRLSSSRVQIRYSPSADVQALVLPVVASNNEGRANPFPSQHARTLLLVILMLCQCKLY